MSIITRAEWGAAPPRYRNLIDVPTPELWLHHSAGALDAGGNGVWWDDVRGIQDFHMAPVSAGGRGWSDIAYSFLVGGGQIFEGRGPGVAGGHTAGHNTISHAICLIGDYQWMTPKREDLEAIAWLIGHGRSQGWWEELTGPHRDASGANTACCGVNLIACIPELRRMAANPEEDDMTPEQVAAAVGEVLDGKARRVSGISSFERYLEVLLAASRDDSARAIADAVAAKIPPGTGASVDQIKSAFAEVLREGVG